MTKLSTILMTTAITTSIIYFREYIPRPSNLFKSINGEVRVFEPWSEQIDEPYCSEGVGVLHHDVWSSNATEDASDIVYGNRKVRMSGVNTWFDKTAYGSIMVSGGCNIWDVVLQFDKMLTRTSASVIGVISEDCVDEELVDPWYNVAENVNMDAFAIYTRTGGRIFQGMYQGLDDAINVTEVVTTIRVVLDFDGDVMSDDGTRMGKLIYKFPTGVVYAYNEMETAWDYRLVVSSQMEESFRIL